MKVSWSRRDILRALAVAGGTGALGLSWRPALAEPPPETKTIRIVNNPALPTLCYGAQYVAEQLLHVEGFDEVQYVEWSLGLDASAVALGKADVGAAWVGDFILEADRRRSIVALSGMHIGCAEVFAGEHVSTFRGLQGKKVAIGKTNDIPHIFFSLIVAYIGLDPRRDIEWTQLPYDQWGPALAEGRVDAILLWPPEVQAFREQNIGRVIWKMTTDRPWRQYFCCMVNANREFVEQHPVATKRALRALLKATDICALEPQRAARAVADNARLPFSYDRALEVFREIPYGEWREYDPLDALRFYAVRMHQLGLIEHIPEDLITECSEWRYLNELKRELKV